MNLCWENKPSKKTNRKSNNKFPDNAYIKSAEPFCKETCKTFKST